MASYRVLKGTFPWEGKQVKAGEIVNDPRPLDTMFKGKFELVSGPARGRAAAAGAPAEEGEAFDVTGKEDVTDKFEVARGTHVYKDAEGYHVVRRKQALNPAPLARAAEVRELLKTLE